jgi:hypothetical protein
LGSTAPQGTQHGPEALQKLVETAMACLTPILKAAMATDTK